MNKTKSPDVRANYVVDSFSAFLVENAHFTDQEEYPILEEFMFSKDIPNKILPFGKAINSQKDLSDTFICFYTPDAEFERIRKNPKKYLHFFKRTAGIIGFDFSVHTDMPIIKQKSQINDNLSLTYFYGNNQIPIIPNIRCGVDELLPEFLSAIPKKQIVAVGTHGFIKERRQKYEWYCFLRKIINTIDPSNIIVYGTLNGNIFDEFKLNVPITCFSPWISERWLEVRNAN